MEIHIPVQKYSFQFLISTVFTKTLVLVSTGGFSNCVNLRWSVILTLSGSCSGNLFKFYSSQRPKHEGRHQLKRNVYFPALPKSSRRKCFISTTTCLFVIYTRLGSDGKKTRELNVFETSPNELLLRDCPVPIPERKKTFSDMESV